MKQTNTNNIIDELVFLLEKGNAHVSFEDAVKELPAELRASKPANLPYNIWQLASHIKITQWDIVEFCLSTTHVSPEWPKEYWPEAVEQVSDKDWNACCKQIKDDRERFIKHLQENSGKLSDAFSYGDGQSLLREALLIADHTAYHTGQILVVRRLLGNWNS